MYNVPSCFTFGNCEERSEFYPGKIPQHEWKRPAGNGSLCSALRRRGYYYSPQISTTGLGNNFSTFNHIQVRGSSHWMVFYWLAVGWRGGERGGKGVGVNNIYGTILFRQENNILPPSLPGQGLEISLTPNCLLYRLYLYWDSVMRKTELIFLSNFIKNLQNARFIPYKYTSKLIS